MNRYLFFTLLVVCLAANAQSFEDNSAKLYAGFKTLTPLYELTEKPTFPGGEKAYQAYLKDNLVYPAFYKKHNINAVVQVNFAIDSTGQIRNAVCYNPGFFELQAEAIRVVLNMPRWSIGKKNGQPVNVTHALKISFGNGTGKVNVKPDYTRLTLLHPNAAVNMSNLNTFNNYYGHWLKEAVAKDSLLRSGETVLRFVLNTDYSLRYIKFTKSVGAENDSIALFALMQSVAAMGLKQNNSALDAKLSATDTLELRVPLKVEREFDEQAYIKTFLNEKGSYKARKDPDAPLGYLMDLIMEPEYLYIEAMPAYSLPQRDTAKKVKVEYMIHGGGGVLARYRYEYDSQGRHIKVTQWNAQSVQVTHTNWSTGKRLTLLYAMPESVFLVIDSNDFRSEHAFNEERLSLRHIKLEVLDATGQVSKVSTIDTRTGHAEEEPYNAAVGQFFYNNQGLADSVIIPEGSDGLFNTFTISYDKNRQMLSAKKVMELEVYGLKNVSTTQFTPVYNEKGRLVRMSRFFDLNTGESAKTPSKQKPVETLYMYDDDGRLTSRIYCVKDTFYTNISYPAPGVVSLMHKTGKYQSTTTYYYNQNGFLIRNETCCNEQGKAVQATRREYDFY